MLDQVLKKTPNGPYIWPTITTDEPLEPSAIKRGWYQAALVEAVEALRFRRLWQDIEPQPY